MGRANKKSISTVHLPEDIVLEILPRLPIRSLLRCKCVCKLWKSLVSNFVLARHAGKEGAIVGYLPMSYGPPIQEKLIHFYSINADLSAVKLPKPSGELPSDFYSFDVFGTCNGLVLFQSYGVIYLWNPSIGSCRAMKQLEVLANEGQNASICSGHKGASGLCFDKSSNDYKAVLLTSRTQLVASLRKGNIQTDGFPYRLTVPFFGHYDPRVLLNGHLHWTMTRIRSGKSKIIYFDEEMDRFKKLPMPEKQEPSEGRLPRYSQLTVLFGCLCLFEGPKCHFDDFDNDVFIMEEYDVKDSWTKLFTIGGTLVPFQPKISSHKLLVLICNKIYTYNLNKKRLTRIKCPPPGLLNIKRVLRVEGCDRTPVFLHMYIGPFMYTKSLASVDLM
ncbi:OLC1v1025481C1 [Oldenlandia corymbosa var. corymbosa]|uniref:OLC1v1025481C1 n=1 Tax=Oldenlandia corymbosa var. corymbosa TaxID=529605 RepID=A0AAV1C510_OLDCO|nr:OLC1v1025481C1 [Oldenlandia corymbosa var. corymbosa]